MNKAYVNSDQSAHAFSQFTPLKDNEYSVNIPLGTKGLIFKRVKGWLNILQPFRGSLILGPPGSGKTKTIVHNYVKQFIEKGFVTALYEYKDDYLSQLAFYTVQANQRVFVKKFGVNATFHAVNFMSPVHSARCNPFTGCQLQSVGDARLAATSILCNLNKSWIEQRGDFFVEQSIDYLTACLWFLKRYTDDQPGRHQTTNAGSLMDKADHGQPVNYCSLPHLIEFALQSYQSVFGLLGTLPELTPFIQPLRDCFEKGIDTDSFDHLEGILAATRVGLSRLVTPELYWIMTGEEALVTINDPQSPKVISLINDPATSSNYGVPLALIATQISRQINVRDEYPKAFIMDELPSIYIDGLDQLQATCRGNKVATCLTMMDLHQLELHYGKKEAIVISELLSTIITGRTMLSADQVARLLNDEEVSGSAPITAEMLTTLPYGCFAGKISPSMVGETGTHKFSAQIPQPLIPWQSTPDSTILPVHPDLEGLSSEQVELRFLENMELVRDQIANVIRSSGSQKNHS